MKKQHRKMILRTMSMCLCSALLLTHVPALAQEENRNPLLAEQEAAIPFEEPVYSFLFQYDTGANKSRLLDKILKIGGEVQYEINSMNCIAPKVTMEQLAQVKEMECVQLVERNYEYQLLTLADEQAAVLENASGDELIKLLAGEPPVREEPDAAEMQQTTQLEESVSQETAAEIYTGLEAAHEQNYKGQNRKIAVFDTGVSAHPDLQLAGGVSFVGDLSTYADTNGHGTQMAGIIAATGEENPAVKGAAPEAELYAVKLAEGDGFINTAAILKGIEWAIEQDMDIINMSFGCYNSSNLLEQAIGQAREADILVVAAAGNDGGFQDEYRLMYPAAYGNVIAVGAGSAYGTESFSNSNEQLDFVAPGRLDTLQADGSYTHVVGTSASAAYVTGTLASLWSMHESLSDEMLLNLTKNNACVAESQKNYVGYGEINVAKSLQSLGRNVILNTVIEEKTVKNSALVQQRLEARKEAALADVDTNMPLAMAAGSCFANEMANAIPISIDQVKSGRINCPGNEVWYKFTTNRASAHPNGSTGLYVMYTISSMDTVGYLYDSSENQVGYNDDSGGDLDFEIAQMLLPNRTYYLRVKAYGSNTGSFDVKVTTIDDDYSNTFDTAHLVQGVYYDDQSRTGSLYTYDGRNDVDCFTFVPARDCVMEIYTEGAGSNKTGILFDQCRTAVQYGTSIGNGNFKITANLKAYQQYYLSVALSNGSTALYDNYTLKFKFVKDYCDQTVNSQYNVVYWFNDDQSNPPHPSSTINPDAYEIRYKHKVFIGDNAKLEYLYRVIDDKFTKKGDLERVLGNPVVNDVLSILVSMGIDLIPYIGSYVNYVIDGASMIYDAMEFINSSRRNEYMACMNTVDNEGIGTTSYIEGVKNTYYTPDGILIESIHYSVNRGSYYGVLYERGNFSLVKLRT